MKISPSILSSDFINLEKTLEMLKEADEIHIDVMDGSFVPNISYGFPIVKALRKHTDMFLDTHLMIINPEKYVESFAEISDSVCFHYEATIHHDSLLRKIKDKGTQAGIALNPSTPVNLLKPILHLLDRVLIMSVNPGFGGQCFIEYSLKKVRELNEMRGNLKFNIEVDGGVNTENALLLKNAGADIVVSGSDIFANPSPEKKVKEYKEI